MAILLYNLKDMKKFFIEKENIDNQKILIKDNEFLHLRKILRLNLGEKIVCFSGDEFEYVCEIVEINKTHAVVEILEKKKNLRNPKICIDFFLGLPKGDKLSIITQKLTELGVSSLFLFEGDFTIAKVNPSKINRLNLVSKESCKQCGRSLPLRIVSIGKFKDIEKFLKKYDLVLFAYEKACIQDSISKLLNEIKKSEKIAVIIGSEGGFSEIESNKLRALNVKEIFLGSRILRVETACIALSGFLSFITEN